MTIKELQSKLESVLYSSQNLNILASSAPAIVNITQALIECLRICESLDAQKAADINEKEDV